MIDREKLLPEWSKDIDRILASQSFSGCFYGEQGDLILDLMLAVRKEALEQAAKTIELYDDATMKWDHMLDSSECAEIIRALKG